MATEFSLKLGLPSVHIDSLTAAFEAVQYLHQLGHSRIACITGEKKIQRTHNLLHGYTQGLRRYGIECESHFVMYGDLTHEAGERALSSMMELKNPPTAIFCHSDEAASGVLSQAKKMGVGVPRNLSVIGFGDAVLSRHCSPPLSTLGQPSEQIGQHAMLLLLNLIGEKIQSIRSRIFDHILIIRGSTAPPLDKLNELMTEELLDYGAISRSVCKSKKKLTELF
jgi:LacI family repressor for deo operon, udp, cdd, tsx, nupC, and nupG